MGRLFALRNLPNTTMQGYRFHSFLPLNIVLSREVSRDWYSSFHLYSFLSAFCPSYVTVHSGMKKLKVLSHFFFCSSGEHYSLDFKAWIIEWEAHISVKRTFRCHTEKYFHVSTLVPGFMNWLLVQDTVVYCRSECSIKKNIVYSLVLYPESSMSD